MVYLTYVILLRSVWVTWPKIVSGALPLVQVISGMGPSSFSTPLQKWIVAILLKVPEVRSI